MSFLSFLFGKRPQRSRITRESLDAMFAKMGAETRWDLNGEMLWGYFFTDRKKEKLQPIAKYLAERGYRVVDLYRTNTHFLHVERVEHHTTATLDARNQAFYALADEFGLDSYDSMDVGLAPRTA